MRWQGSGRGSVMSGWKKLSGAMKASGMLALLTTDDALLMLPSIGNYFPLWWPLFLVIQPVGPQDLNSWG